MKRRDFPFIRLAPWEHAPGAGLEEIEARAQNVVPFEWRGQALQVAARFANCGDGLRYLFARFIGEEDEANWVLGYGSSPDGPIQMKGAHHLKLLKRLSDHEKSRFLPFGRLFYFQAEELGTPHLSSAFVGTDGSGCWINSTSEKQNEAAFAFSLDGESTSFRLALQAGESLRYVAAREIRVRLLKEVEDPATDTRFALNWGAKSQDEREDLLLKVERGSVDEFRHLLVCALRIESVVQKQVGHWVWFMEGETSSLNYWDEEGSFPQWVEMPVRLRVWERIAFEYFAPSPHNALLHRHLCARDWFNNRPSFLNIVTQTPTQHERLEAALWLRDWARDKIAPRKLQLLLSHL